MTSSWIEKYTDIVKQCTDLTFSKVCIVDKRKKIPLAYTNNDIPTKYECDYDWKTKIEIDEIKELMDDWSDIDRNTFYFFGTKYQLLMREDTNKDKIDERLIYGFIRESSNKTNLNIPNDIYKMVWKQFQYECKYIVGFKPPSNAIVAYQFKTVWIIVNAEIRNRISARRNHGGGGNISPFFRATNAFDSIMKNVFNKLSKEGL